MEQNKVIKVSGMHCKSCEMILEGKIREVEGVRKVKAYTSRSEIKLSGNFDMKKVEAAIEGAGYKVGLEEKSFLTKKPQVYKEIFASLAILWLIYSLFTLFGLSKLLPSVTGGDYSYGVVVLLGMTAGFSTCMALVGGLVLGFTSKFREKHPEITGFAAFVPNIYFNIGRVVGFFFLGGLLGQLGTVVKVSSSANGWLLLAVAFALLLIGLQLTEVSPVVSKINFTMPKFLSKFAIGKSKVGEYSHSAATLAGSLTFFLPCGFTQAVQLVAISSGSFIRGALLMSLFALGTTPGLLLVGSLASFTKGKAAARVFRFVGVLVVVLALTNLNAAKNLLGIQLPNFELSSNSQSVEDQALPVVENGVQTVNMDVVARGYTPNHFTVKKGIPVKWVANVKDISTCASYIVATDMNIQQLLRRGENVLTFTPNEVGTLNFTCSMGMYSGDFTVVE